MSARMAAATGDPRWEKRYRRLESRLYAARGPTRQASELERRALSLASSDQRPAASLLLLSDAHEAQKKSYVRDIAQHADRARGKLDADIRTERRNVNYGLTATGLATAFSLVIWIILFLRASNRRAALESAIGSFSESAIDKLAVQDRSRELLEGSTLGIQIADWNGKRLFVNQALTDLMGYESPAELLAAKPAALVASEDMPRLLEIRPHHFRGEAAPTSYEFVGIRKDKSRISVQVVTSLLTWQGEPAIQHAFIDLTARKQAEEALKISEANLSAAQRLTGVGSWEANLERHQIRYSRELCRILNVDPEVGMPRYDEFLKRVHPNDRDAVDKRNKHAHETGEPIDHQYRIVQRDGTVRHVHSMAEVFFDHLGKPVRVTGALQDITKQVLAQEALQASELRLSRMLDITPEAVIALDRNHRIELFNQAAEEVFGYSADEIVGRPLDVLLPPNLENSHHKFFGSFAAASQASRLMSGRGEFVGVKKDGTKFPATASISKMELDGEMIFTAIFHDISSRNSAETAMIAAMEDAEVANRAKSEFLANMSHEFRTPLNAIIGFAEVMIGETFGPIGNARYREYIDDIHYSAGHLRDLVSDILDLSKVESGMDELYEENVDIPVLINATLRLVQQRADKHGIELGLEIDEELPALRADQRKLKQILVNLLSNAVKFTPLGGKVTLRAWCKESSGHVFQVVDTGIGIASEDIPTVLAQFGQAVGAFNRQREGTGLGLPLTKSLIELHGGSFDLQSEIGQGTTVTARFPAQRIVRASDRPEGLATDRKTAG